MVRVDDEHTIPLPVVTNDLLKAEELPFLHRVRPDCSDLEDLLDISEDSDYSD